MWDNPPAMSLAHFIYTEVLKPKPLKALANAMRVKLRIEKIPFGELTNALDDGRIDMVLSGMAITPERSTKASFVGPYMMGGKSILATREAIEQLNKQDMRGLILDLRFNPGGLLSEAVSVSEYPATTGISNAVAISSMSSSLTSLRS